MNHLTVDELRRPDDHSIRHLETCDRCRRRLVPDVDVAKVRRRLLSAVGEDPAPRGRLPRWWAAATAAVVLGAVVGPVAWLTARAPTQPAGGTTVNTAPLAPPVELPQRPPEPRPEDGAPPAPPRPAPDRPSFEMTFRVGDDVAGRLIWARPDFFEAMRVNRVGDAWTFDYDMYRTADGVGIADPDDSTFQLDLSSPAEPSLPPDPVVPWRILIEPMDPPQAWAALAADGVDMAPAVPIHPEATVAWATAGFRLEVADDGIPLLVDRPGFQRFEVTSLDRRAIRTGEVGNGTRLGFGYALHLAATTSPEQYGVLADGIVTFADYRKAAAAAATCAGTAPVFDDEAGLYIWADDAVTAECVARYVDDIEAVWRLDSRWLGEDEWTEIYYTVEGVPEAAEMYRNEEGPEMPLVSGDGWALSISERPPGYCTRSSFPGGFSEGCWVPSQMQIPGTLYLDESLSFGPDGPTGASLLGVVTADVDRVVISFAFGGSVEVTPGDRRVFGFRGFGLLYHPGTRGAAVKVDLYDGDTLVGSYETTTCGPHPAAGEVMDAVCGDR